MKRESMAERTLNLQIKRMKEDEASLTSSIENIAAQRNAIQDQRRKLENEVARLTALRRRASEERK